jgi:RNA ligase
MDIYDLLDATELYKLRELGYISKREHPTEPLSILNYTDKAQLADADFWAAHPALSHCRGLIYNSYTNEIVARPFRKFWNHNQPAADKIDLKERVYATDKVDGSLGIMYREPSGDLAIATRGSFTSDQALHATHLLRTKYQMSLAGPRDPRERYHAADDETFLFEIVYPENRIVLDYHGADELILLGSVEIDSGYVSLPAAASIHLDWTGWTAQTFGYNTLGDALAAAPRPNAEGFVIATRGGEKMVKIKQEDYVRLHKIIFGLTEKSIWRALVAGDSLDSLLEPLPDEFHAWVREVYGRLKGAASTWGEGVREEYRRIIDAGDWEPVSDYQDHAARAENKKRFAQIVKGDRDSWAYFQLYIGRGADIEQTYLEKHLEPVGATGPASTKTEEVCLEWKAGSRCPGCMGCPFDREED